MIYGIIAIIGGLIAVSGLIIAKKPNAQELLDKVTPYQGWIGIILAFSGLWGVIQCILNLGMLGDYFLSWLFWLIMSVSEFIVGFILGYGLISQWFLEKDETAKEKGAQLRAKLINYQVPAGFVLIISAILYIVL